MADTKTPDPITQARGRVAGLSRSRTYDDAEFVEARQDLAAKTLGKQARHAVRNVPQLTDAQISDIVRILRGGDAA